MSVFKTNGSTDKCCDDVNMQAPPQGGGNPPIFQPRETWTICYGVGGDAIANQTGPTLADQISSLFSNLKPSCQDAFASALNNKINQQVNNIIQNFINNPLAGCPAGQCRDIEIGLFDTPNNNGSGSVEVCCKDGELDTSNGDPTNGWVIGSTSTGGCG
jgi:hypothetical protein